MELVLNGPPRGTVALVLGISSALSSDAALQCEWCTDAVAAVLQCVVLQSTEKNEKIHTRKDLFSPSRFKGTSFIKFTRV